MSHFGLPELLAIPIATVAVALPIASFVLIVMTYNKVRALEQRLPPRGGA